MGFSDEIHTRTGRAIDMMKRHPNYKPLVPEAGESMVAFTLRWAAHLISPPQESEESYELECVDIAVAILALQDDIDDAWCAYYGLDRRYFDGMSLSRTLKTLQPLDGSKRKFTELLGPNYLRQLETEACNISYHYRPAGSVKDLDWPERYEVLFLRRDGVGDTVSYVEIFYYPAVQQWAISNIIDDDDVLFRSFNEAASHYMKLEKPICKEGYPFCRAIRPNV